MGLAFPCSLLSTSQFWNHEVEVFGAQSMEEEGSSFECLGLEFRVEASPLSCMAQGKKQR